jgi:hypothetical protein
VIIKVERSGGFAGILTSSEMDTKDLPSVLINKLKRIMENKNPVSLPVKVAPRGAADYYTYKITIKGDDTEKILECNQYDITDNLKSIVKYVEKNSKKI